MAVVRAITFPFRFLASLAAKSVLGAVLSFAIPILIAAALIWWLT